MKIWIGEPDPQSIAWVYHPSAKTQEDQASLIKIIEHYGYNSFTVDLYSVNDLYWVKELHAGAAYLKKETDIQFHINVHVHADRPDVIEFINNSPYLEYVPIVGI
ncbi:MAG: hypothetical protein E7167_01265 [Firmicutes bacterium]|nr:hypothetical protein [Bacillota bacterium]